MDAKPKTELEIERRWIVLQPPQFKGKLGEEIVEGLGERWRELKITQMYLESKHTERIRQTQEGAEIVYHHTIKKPAKKEGGQWETESEITDIEFEKLMDRLDPTKQAVVKTRYVMKIGDSDLKYELDSFIYPIQTWILEVEVPSLDTEVSLPKVLFGDTIEVTNINGLSNYKIASNPSGAEKKIKKLILKNTKD